MKLHDTQVTVKALWPPVIGLFAVIITPKKTIIYKVLIKENHFLYIYQ